MNTQSKVRTDFLLNRLYEVQNLQSEQKFVESLELIEKTLISEEMLESGDPSNAKIHFLYLKAIALDLSDRLDEALPMFFQLVMDYPGAPDFESSLQVVLSKLEHRVKEIIQATPDSPEIYRIFKIFERYSCPPYWLIHAGGGSRGCGWEDGRCVEEAGKSSSVIPQRRRIPAMCDGDCEGLWENSTLRTFKKDRASTPGGSALSVGFGESNGGGGIQMKIFLVVLVPTLFDSFRKACGRSSDNDEKPPCYS